MSLDTDDLVHLLEDSLLGPAWNALDPYQQRTLMDAVAELDDGAGEEGFGHYSCSECAAAAEDLDEAKKKIDALQAKLDRIEREIAT